MSRQLNGPLFSLTSGFTLAFCIWALIDLNSLSEAVGAGFSTAVAVFGWAWQAGLLLVFLISIGLAIHPAARQIMGPVNKPEFSGFQWGSMIMCTLLAGGGVFWAAGEPMAHYLSPPPIFETTTDTRQLAAQALAQSFMHWGFLAWSILGSLSALLLMELHHNHGYPLAPRTLMAPLIGRTRTMGWMGTTIDAACIIAVVAGTVGPIGFLGLQVGFGLNALLGIPNTLLTQLSVILALVSLYTVSALSGVSKGIQLLSRLNILLGVSLLFFMVVAGPTAHIVQGFGDGMLIYLSDFFKMAMYRADADWLGWWTVFFWGWFLGYGPMMAIFIARISKGRSARSMIVMVSIIAPLVTNVWFCIIGGTGLGLELENPGSVSTAFEGFNLPAALIAITQALPFGHVIGILFLILTSIFVATTGDSMTYVISVAMTRQEDPPPWLRVFWGVSMGIMAAVLLTAGESGVQSLQSFIVVTAVPVFFVLLPSIWCAPKQLLQRWSQQKSTPH